MKTLGILGFGAFGEFMAKHLKPYFSVTVYDPRDLSEIAKSIGVNFGTLQEAASGDIVVFAVPVQFLEGLVSEAKLFLKPGALVMDVSSVKVKPVEIMTRLLPDNVDIVATHPLFGPQSAGGDIKPGFNFVLCPIRTSRLEEIKDFLEKNFGLNILERTPEEHDKQMAYAQGLTHLIGRALKLMDIPDIDQKTIAYGHLLQVKELVGKDSLELFLTIENENPYAREVRDAFLSRLEELVKQIGS